VQTSTQRHTTAQQTPPSLHISASLRETIPQTKPAPNPPEPVRPEQSSSKAEAACRGSRAKSAPRPDQVRADLSMKPPDAKATIPTRRPGRDLALPSAKRTTPAPVPQTFPQGEWVSHLSSAPSPHRAPPSAPAPAPQHRTRQKPRHREVTRLYLSSRILVEPRIPVETTGWSASCSNRRQRSRYHR